MEMANRTLGEISAKMAEFQDRGKIVPSSKGVGDGEKVEAYEFRNILMAVMDFAKKMAASLDPSSEGEKQAQATLEEALRLEKALTEMSP